SDCGDEVLRRPEHRRDSGCAGGFARYRQPGMGESQSVALRRASARADAMTPERFQQIDKLFDLALERKSSERGHFLDQACAGDEALRTKLESLLRLHEQASGALANPPSHLADEILAVREQTHAVDGSASDWPEGASKVLGRYVVTEKLGG